MSTSEQTKPDDAKVQDNRVPLNYREQFKSKGTVTKYVDPCEAAAKASMKCLDDNDYDRGKCSEVFQAYRICKKKWLDQRREDRRAGRPSSIDI